jgi:tripartite-type tricarboxylate transporter receptor subunit TctC
MKSALLRGLASLFVCAALMLPAQAQDFPNRTVRLLVGFAPGGTTDLLARIIADELKTMWKQSVVVENRPGADGIVATTALHNAPGDGYTLMMSTNALVITPHLKPLPYDPIKDFEPITIVGQEFHHFLVTPKLPAKNVKEFIDLAKSTSGGLTFASAGPGSAPFLGMRRFMLAAGITNMVHVPYPGSAPAAMALVTSCTRCFHRRQPRFHCRTRGGSACSPSRDRNGTRTCLRCRRSLNRACRASKATLGSH